MLCIGIIGFSTQSVTGKTLIVFSSPDTAVIAGQSAYYDTLQHRSAELIRIIGISTDSVSRHIHEIDNQYSGRLAAVYDSLSLL